MTTTTQTTQSAMQLRIPCKSGYWRAGVVAATIGALLFITLAQNSILWLVLVAVWSLAIGVLLFFSPKATQALTGALAMLVGHVSLGTLLVFDMTSSGYVAGLAALAAWAMPIVSAGTAVLAGLTIAGVVRSKMPVLSGVTVNVVLLTLILLLIPIEATHSEFGMVITGLFLLYLSALLFLCSLSRDPSRTYAAKLPTQGAVALRTAAQTTAHKKRSDTTTVPAQLLEEKSIALYVILTIVTFGIFGLFWIFQIVQRVQLLTGKDASPWGEFLLVILVPFYILYWMHTRVKLLYETATDYGVRVNDNSTICVVLPILNFAIVSWAIVQNDLNIVARSLAEQAKK